VIAVIAVVQRDAVRRADAKQHALHTHVAHRVCQESGLISDHDSFVVTFRRGLGFGSDQWQALPGSASVELKLGGVRNLRIYYIPMTFQKILANPKPLRKVTRCAK
jgi:hypothetical protein